MAAKHQLNLEIPDYANPAILKIVDTSIYANNLNVSCGILEITIPGFVHPVSIEVEQNFNMLLTACNLGLQKEGCGQTAAELPDGRYTVRYSVSPNDRVWAEYDVLRQSQTLGRFYRALAAVDAGPCEPCKDTQAKFAELSLIRSFLDLSKAQIEYSGHVEKGIETFLYAQSRLNKFFNECSL